MLCIIRSFRNVNQKQHRKLITYYQVTNYFIAKQLQMVQIIFKKEENWNKRRGAENSEYCY